MEFGFVLILLAFFAVKFFMVYEVQDGYVERYSSPAFQADAFRSALGEPSEQRRVRFAVFLWFLQKLRPCRRI